MNDINGLLVSKGFPGLPRASQGSPDLPTTLVKVSQYLRGARDLSCSRGRRARVRPRAGIIGARRCRRRSGSERTSSFSSARRTGTRTCSRTRIGSTWDPTRPGISRSGTGSTTAWEPRWYGWQTGSSSRCSSNEFGRSSSPGTARGSGQVWCSGGWSRCRCATRPLETPPPSGEQYIHTPGPPPGSVADECPTSSDRATVISRLASDIRNPACDRWPWVRRRLRPAGVRVPELGTRRYGDVRTQSPAFERSRPVRASRHDPTGSHPSQASRGVSPQSAEGRSGCWSLKHST